MNYKIRKANKSDIDVLLSLSRYVTNHCNRTFLPKEMVDDYLRSTEFAGEITDHITQIDILCSDDDVIGMCRFNGNVIESLMVDPDYQSKGAATHFLNELLAQKTKIYNEIKLECFESNIRARKFYEKIGFENMHLYKNIELNQYMCEYRKRL